MLSTEKMDGVYDCQSVGRGSGDRSIDADRLVDRSGWCPRITIHQLCRGEY